MHQSTLVRSACLIIILWGLSAASSFLLPVLIAGFLGFLMAPFHKVLVRKCHFPDVLAVLVSAIIFLSPAVLLGVVLVHQAKGFVQDAPHLATDAQAKLQDMVSNSSLASRMDIDVQSIVDKVSESLGKGVGVVMGGFAAVAGVGSHLLLVFVFAILFLASRVHLRKSAEHILSHTHGIDGPEILDQATDLIQRFLLARMLIVVIIGTLSTIALKILGVNYFVFVGIFFGVMTLVPAIGSIIGVGIGALAALITGRTAGETLVIIGVLFGISALENYVLTPKLVGNRLNLNALTCFIGLYAGSQLWGIWGMFLSIPILGVVRIVFASIPSLEAWGELLADKVEMQKPIAAKVSTSEGAV